MLCSAQTGLVLALLAVPAPRVFAPSASRVDTYGESFSFTADLDDGSYAWAQLSITNLGPGEAHGICRGLYVRPGRATWAAQDRVSKDEWRYDSGSDRLVIGACFAEAGPEGSRIHVSLEGGSMELLFEGPAEPSSPHRPIVIDRRTHKTRVLHPRAAVRGRFAASDAASFDLVGEGYVDQSRSTIPPGSLAKRWVRFRALDGQRPLLVLGRESMEGSFYPVWIWDGLGKPRTAGSFTVERKGEDEAKSWIVDLKADGRSVRLRSTAFLHRSSPLDALGALGSALRPIVGAPVTYTHRALLEEAGRPPVAGVMEVTEED